MNKGRQNTRSPQPQQACDAEDSNTIAGTAAADFTSHAKGNTARSAENNSHAEGLRSVSSGANSHAEGASTTASGTSSHAEGNAVLADGAISHAEGSSTRSRGAVSHAEGFRTLAAGITAHSEGNITAANGNASHSEGNRTAANGNFSHSEGNSTTAGGESSHAEGKVTLASGDNSHAEGEQTIASGIASHAEGQNTAASGSFCHAEGVMTTASGTISHAEGFQSKATAEGAHAEGLLTMSTNIASHSEGQLTVASGRFSHAEGVSTSTNGIDGAHIMGQNGDANDLPFSWYLANGTSAANRGLAAKILGNGRGVADQGWFAGGADYAEMFETLDGEPIEPGYFVTLKQGKIKKANEASKYVLGVTSAAPAYLGNAMDLRWKNKYLTDKWGRIIYHDITVSEVKDPSGGILVPEHVESHPVLNPKWNKEQQYVSRLKRPEWAAVCLMGQILVRDDGTCRVDGYCRPGSGGIATASSDGYIVMERISKNQILIMFR